MHKAPYDHTIPLELFHSKNASNVSVPTTAEKSETQQLAVILDLCLRKTLACSGLSVIGDDRIKRPGDEWLGGLVEKEERSDVWYRVSRPLFRSSSPPPWPRAWNRLRKLWQEIHSIVATSMFSKIFACKMFSVHTKTKCRRFKISRAMLDDASGLQRSNRSISELSGLRRRNCSRAIFNFRQLLIHTSKHASKPNPFS